MADLPAITACFVVLGTLLTEIEAERPGTLRRIRRKVEDEANRAAVVRLRGANHRAEVVGALNEAASWLEHAEDVTYLVLGKPEERKRRKHG